MENCKARLKKVLAKRYELSYALITNFKCINDYISRSETDYDLKHSKATKKKRLGVEDDVREDDQNAESKQNIGLSQSFIGEIGVEKFKGQRIYLNIKMKRNWKSDVEKITLKSEPSSL